MSRPIPALQHPALKPLLEQAALTPNRPWRGSEASHTGRRCSPAEQQKGKTDMTVAEPQKGDNHHESNE